MDSLLTPTLAAHPWLWASFAFGVPLALIYDLGLWARVRGRPQPLPSTRAAWISTGIYTLLATAFAAALAWVGGEAGLGQAQAFMSVYVVEFALSADNLFVFMLIFDAFGVPQAQAQRVLVWGIAGALALRFALIAAGGALLSRYAWLFYPVGALLIGTGLKLLLTPEAPQGEATTLAPVRLMQRLVPVANPAHRLGQPPGAFIVRVGGRLMATPLGLVLLAIEAADVVFALDSVPASFAMTDDIALIYSANVCAILGLRALYTALAAALHGLRFLRPALAVILIGIGAKMAGHSWFSVSNGLSLTLIACVLTIAGLASWQWPHRDAIKS